MFKKLKSLNQKQKYGVLSFFACSIFVTINIVLFIVKNEIDLIMISLTIILFVTAIYLLR